MTEQIIRKTGPGASTRQLDELLTVAEIADELGWAPSTVRSFVKEWGLQGHHDPDDTRRRQVMRFRWGDVATAATTITRTDLYGRRVPVR